MMYLNCTRCGGIVGKAKDQFEATDLFKEHLSECDDAKP